MSNPYSLSFSLKQHTPLIHFQHQQVGATLRATELKPKLDTFIMEQLTKKIGYDAHAEFKKQALANKPEWKNWLVGKGKAEHMALDYKVTIQICNLQMHEPIEEPYVDNKGNDRMNSFPGFFGNMGEENQQDDSVKKFIKYDEIKVIIFSLNDELLKGIKNYFPAFVANHNFGSRQSKGYGSFYFVNEADYPVQNYFKYYFQIDANTVNLPPSTFSRINRRSKDYQTFYRLFYGLTLFYSSLRSGINIPNSFYFKSLMFLYAKSQTPAIQWDKKTIRDKFQFYKDTYKEVKSKRKGDDNPVNFTATNQRLMRDMLGLSSQESWLAYKDSISKEGQWKDEEKRVPLITRFKSPITFKILQKNGTNFQVFLGTSPIPNEYFGQKFHVKSANYRPTPNDSPLIMQLPTTNEFNIDSYLNFCFKTVFPTDADFDAHVQNSSSSEAKVLKQIYSQLRNC